MSEYCRELAGCMWHCALVSERKPTADQQLTGELDELLAQLDQLERQLTGAQQEPLPTDMSQAGDMISRYEVLCLISSVFICCDEGCVWSV